MKGTLKLVAALIVAVGLPASSAHAESDFRVTLIGTGIPNPLPDRFGPSTLVEAGGQKLLFDAGRGATIRLYQLGIPLRDVNPLFITHFHSDHTVGLPDLWLTGWLPGPWARRTTPLHIIGPVGTKELAENLERAYAADIHIRMADEKLPREGAVIEPEEFAHEGVVYDRDGVRVTAFEVNHGDEIKPAYGYRVDYKGHAVVISGDTKFNENVVKYGTGADLLIHEVGAVRPEIAQEPPVRLIMAHHTSPRDAGTVFSRAHPRLAVYTHLVLPTRPNVPPLTADELVAQTRETYDGPLVVGEDLMRFDIEDGGVTVHRDPGRK
jgi:ribonuclease Z